MESTLKKEFDCSSVRSYGSGGGGCISAGQGYMVDDKAVFVKTNDKEGARVMFDGEAASLEAILKTQTVKVPKPIKVFDLENGGSALVMEYLDMHGLRKYSGTLGTQLARMHLHNAEQGKLQSKSESSVHQSESIQHVNKFGFHITTCCGFIPQDNSWEEDWVVFFTRHKLQQQLSLIEQTYHDREAQSLWSEVQLKIHKLFEGVEIVPSLLHGDLWGGNAAEVEDGPVVFDAACFYGHNEFDLAIAMMFGGFGHAFFQSYHKLLPKAPGFEERNKLYQLFHYLNHWNHFGTGYRSQSISLLKHFAKL